MKFPKLGATQDFPRGKLNPTDEGGLRMAISEEDGNVRIDFGKPVAWFAMPPNEAIQLANLLIARANKLRST